MKQTMQEAIKLTEQICASRYYTERGRAALIDAVAAGMFLSDEDKRALLAAQQPQYIRLQEVRNALLLLCGDQVELREAVLNARAEVLAQQTERYALQTAGYSDRSSWLMHMHQIATSRDEADQFEVACFRLATGKWQEAYDKFVHLGTRGNLSALWLALGVARIQNNQADELQRIVELLDLYEQGLIDCVPDEIWARRNELQANGYAAQSNRDFCGTKIGF